MQPIVRLVSQTRKNEREGEKDGVYSFIDRVCVCYVVGIKRLYKEEEREREREREEWWVEDFYSVRTGTSHDDDGTYRGDGGHRDDLS